MKNVAEVMEKVRPIIDLDTYVVKPNGNTSIVLDPGRAFLRHNGEELTLSREVIAPMMRRLGVSQRLMEQLSITTLEGVAADLLVQAEPFVVVIKQDTGISIVSSVNCKPVDVEQLIGVIDEEAPEATAQRVLVSPETISVRIEVATEKMEPVVKDDLVQAGALIEFSPIGTIQPMVQAYTSRLVCTNGMVDMRVYRHWKHTGGNGEFGEWLHESVREAIGSFEGIVEHYKQLALTTISDHDRPIVLDALLYSKYRESYLGRKASDAVRARAIEEPPESAWDMVNLISWATSHVVEEPYKIAQGMQVAADFIRTDAYMKSCPVCHQLTR